MKAGIDILKINAQVLHYQIDLKTQKLPFVSTKIRAFELIEIGALETKLTEINDCIKVLTGAQMVIAEYQKPKPGLFKKIYSYATRKLQRR